MPGLYSIDVTLTFLHLLTAAQEYDNTIEKLSMKTLSMASQRRKLQQQLKHNQETGEDLHEVDFEQLKIENSTYIEKIDQRNRVWHGMASCLITYCIAGSPRPKTGLRGNVAIPQCMQRKISFADTT